MLLRSLNLRRLSYVLFSGDKNQYLTQLPGIQEKLVDLLRSGTTAPVVLSEVRLQFDLIWNALFCLLVLFSFRPSDALCSAGRFISAYGCCCAGYRAIT